MYQYSGYPRVNVAPSRIYTLPKEIWDEIILHLLDYSFLEVQTIIRPTSYYFYSLYSNSFCRLPPHLWEQVFANLPFTDLVTIISLTCSTFRKIITNPTSPTLQSILLRENFGKGTAGIYARRIAAGDVHVHPVLSLSRETNTFPRILRWIGTGEDHRVEDTLALKCLGATGFRKYSKANATSPPVECLQVRIPGVGRSITVSKKRIVAEHERRIKKLRREWERAAPSFEWKQPTVELAVSVRDVFAAVREILNLELRDNEVMMAAQTSAYFREPTVLANLSPFSEYHGVNNVTVRSSTVRRVMLDVAGYSLSFGSL